MKKLITFCCLTALVFFLYACLTPNEAWQSIKMKYSQFKVIPEDKHGDSDVKLSRTEDTFIKLFGVRYNSETRLCEFVTIIVERKPDEPTPDAVHIPTVLFSLAGGACDFVPDQPIN